MATKRAKNAEVDPGVDVIGPSRKGSLKDWSDVILGPGTRPRKKPKAEDVAHISEDLRPLAVPVSALKLDPRNARLHNQRNLEAIKASLSTFTQRKNLVVRKDGTVIAGNGTLEVAQVMGWKWIAAVVVDDDDVTASAYALADNKTGELSEWDVDVLGDLLKEIKATDEDLLSTVGFTEQDVDRLINDGIEASDSPDDEWEDSGMPKYEVEDQLKTYASFTVHCKTEEDLKAFSELVGQTLTKKTRSIWYPPEQPVVLRDRVVVGAGDES